ncbi:hypothetical protein P7K49_007884 [Saguinus oedipus]|uniref:Uncharacterized protein n=1 Tax=Saguinus oedipus TaxID=9490 RepID=A0ABQ9VYJ8_SAGOE|nr:hypothetical protein P7K49_007884 [Saguinus oedipus]
MAQGVPAVIPACQPHSAGKQVCHSRQGREGAPASRKSRAGWERGSSDESVSRKALPAPAKTPLPLRLRVTLGGPEGREHVTLGRPGFQNSRRCCETARSCALAPPPYLHAQSTG